MATCTQCGAEVAENIKFCPKCGTQIDAGAGEAGQAPGASQTGSSGAASGGASSSAAGTASAGGFAGSGAGGQAAAVAENNVPAAVAYLVITAIIFLLIEPYKNDRFVRFHSFQAIFYWLACLGIVIVLSALGFVVGALSMMLLPLVQLASFVLWILLVVKAYQGQWFKLPVIGDLAEKQV